jgi:dihydroorotate dehydrogenase
MYTIIRNLLFVFPPEGVHYFSMNLLQLACRVPWIRKYLQAAFQPKSTQVTEAFGLTFRNRIGLAAGFDKNAQYLQALETLGFGFVEIGTVTPLPQAGNEKPRLFRLPADKALINRMGFNNDGVKEVAQRLKLFRAQFPDTTLIIGGNIGKNKLTPNEDAWKDYERCFLALADVVDYFVVNVSSPNTPGLRELQEKSALHKILTHLQTLNSTQIKPKPILLKIAPDLSHEALNDVIELAIEIKLDGLVATNTTISRAPLPLSDAATVQAIGAGGLSGLPVQSKSTEIVRYIQQHAQGRIPIIASGGVFNSKDAQEKIEAGGTLVQVWTGFVYEGPAIVKKICANL